MSTQQLKTAVGAGAAAPGTAVAKKEPQNFPQFLQAYQSEIARALPKHLNADRMARVALTEFRKNQKLAECEPRSVFASVIVLSQLGLEPGVLGQGFLVPYYNKRTRQYECQAIPGWKGLVDLVTRTGRATVDAQSVFPGDHFVYAKGTRPFVEHTESGNEPENRDRDFTHVYAVGWVRNAEHPKFEVWTRERVVKHRDRYNKVGDAHYSYENFEQYAKKLPLLQVLKYMPASPEMQTAIELEAAADRGGQGLDLSNVIDGSWSVPQGDASGGSQSGNQEGGPSPHYSKDAAQQALKEAGAIEDLEKAWAAIALDYDQSKREIEPEIDQLYKSRKSELSKL